MTYAYLYVMKILRYATAVEEAAPPAFESVRGRERRGEKGEEGVGGFSQPTNYVFAYSKEMLYHPYTPHRGGFRPNNRMTVYDKHICANTCL